MARGARDTRSQRLAAAVQGLGRHPWVDRAVELAWGRLEGQVGEALMPREEDCGYADLNDLSEMHYNPWDTRNEPGEQEDEELLEERGWCAEELGCGAYGCVMPTWTEGMVLKLGTDASEAFFAAHSMAIGDVPEGIVRYDHAYRVKWAQREGVPVFALWRTEAYDIGFITDGDTPAAMDGRDALYKAKRAGGAIRAAFTKAILGPAAHSSYDRVAKKLFPLFADGIGGEGAEIWLEQLAVANDDYSQAGGSSYLIGLARELAQYDEAVAALEDNRVLAPVGQAMRFYLEHGLVLGDTHANNIGRDIDGTPIITDPGVCTPIHSDMFYADIPEV